MPDRSLAFILLSLFIPEERAAEIEGDLIEEGAHHGRSWFMFQVIGTSFALCKESFRQAPILTVTLGLATAGLSVLICGALGRVFFAPDALLPAPLIGLAMTPASAFLTGFGLGYFAAGLGIRAAIVSMILLILLFVVTETASGLAALPLPIAILSWIGYFFLSIAIFLAPMFAGSVCGHRGAVRLP